MSSETVVRGILLLVYFPTSKYHNINIMMSSCDHNPKDINVVYGIRRLSSVKAKNGVKKHVPFFSLSLCRIDIIKDLNELHSIFSYCVDLG